MADSHQQQQLVTLVRQARQAEHDLVDSLSAEARDAYGKIDGWAAKDVIMHVNAWKEVLAENLADGREGREADTRPEFLVYNDAMFERFQHASWEEVNAYADAVVATLIEEIERYDDDQLRQPQFYTWMREAETITSQVLGSCLMHAYQHLSEVYVQNGNPDRAIALHNTTIPAYETLNATPRALGTAQYNLACTYALMGHGDLAIPLIRNAFELRPDLMEWAKTDTDLDSIREAGEFQSLYPQEA